MEKTSDSNKGSVGRRGSLSLCSIPRNLQCPNISTTRQSDHFPWPTSRPGWQLMHGENNWQMATFSGELIIPLLTVRKCKKHVQFSRHLRNHWGLSPEKQKKVLLIHYDEKWFYSLVTWSQGKMQQSACLSETFAFLPKKHQQINVDCSYRFCI